MTDKSAQGDSQDTLEELLRIRSPRRRGPDQGGGISPLDMLELPPDLREAMNLLMRKGLSSAQEIAGPMQIDVERAAELLDTLAARGHVRQIGEGEESVYEPILGRSRRPRLSSNLWRALEEETESE